MTVSPLLGYNTNVRHKGKVYHIQTEDSGIQHPHIITHLFADGGRIVASRKTAYAEHVGTAEYPGVVKKMMQEQHKAMFIALRDGQFDEAETLYAQATGAKLPAAPVPTEAGGKLSRSTGVGDKATAKHEAPAAATKDADAPSEAAQAKAAPEPPKRGRTLPPPPPRKSPSARPPQPAPVVDVAALERAASERERESTAAGNSSPRPAGRYQATQPPKPIARPKKPPTEPPPSIFGNDLLSEKSLDEVILSYLSEDADGPKKP